MVDVRPIDQHEGAKYLRTIHPADVGLWRPAPMPDAGGCAAGDQFLVAHKSTVEPGRFVFGVATRGEDGRFWLPELWVSRDVDWWAPLRRGGEAGRG